MFVINSQHKPKLRRRAILSLNEDKEKAFTSNYIKF